MPPDRGGAGEEPLEPEKAPKWIPPWLGREL